MDGLGGRGSAKRGVDRSLPFHGVLGEKPSLAQGFSDANVEFEGLCGREFISPDVEPREQVPVEMVFEAQPLLKGRGRVLETGLCHHIAEGRDNEKPVNDAFCPNEDGQPYLVLERDGIPGGEAQLEDVLLTIGAIVDQVDAAAEFEPVAGLVIVQPKWRLAMRKFSPKVLTGWLLFSFLNSTCRDDMPKRAASSSWWCWQRLVGTLSGSVAVGPRASKDRKPRL